MEQKIDRHDRILQLVRSRGPLLPAQLNKELNTNVLFASAMLGELVDRGVLKLSRAKIGSSPVYYVPGQEARLELLYKYLAKPEQTAYDLLKQNKILRDYDQQPVIRVALRAIKDFAFPLEVTLDNNTEIFWRWHLVSEKESEEMIKKHLNIRPEQPKTEAQEVQREALQTAPIAAETKIFPEQKTLPTQQIHTPQTDVMQEQKKEPQKVPETIPEAKLDEEIKKVEEEIEEELDKLEEKPKAKPSKPRARSLQKKTPEEVQETLGKELVLPEDDELFQRVDAFFKNNHIEITAIDVIRKESEIDFIIDLPTNLGAVKYFCKVKSKQKINDGDLSSAYIQGQIKKMPILFLTFGELTTKAKQLLSTEFKTMFVRKID